MNKTLIKEEVIMEPITNGWILKLNKQIAFYKDAKDLIENYFTKLDTIKYYPNDSKNLKVTFIIEEINE